MKITEICITPADFTYGRRAFNREDRKEKVAGPRRLFRIEFYFDGLRGFVRRGFPFPFANSVRRRLHQKGMPTFHGNVLDHAVAGNDGVDFDDPAQMHTAGQRGILGHDFVDHFSIARLDIFLGKSIERSCEYCREEQRGSEMGPPRPDHNNNSLNSELWKGKVTRVTILMIASGEPTARKPRPRSTTSSFRRARKSA
jgi:hypothetical protein